MAGLLISFDGLDSTGKATQVKRFVDHLQKDGHTVRLFETPDYATPTGQQLKQLLQNKDGVWAQTPWVEKMKLFAANRREHREEVLETLASGGVVVYDRYVPSSLAFFAAENQGSREAVHHLVAEEEYETNQMPREAGSIFLDVSPEIANRLLHGRKQHRQDDHEYTDDLAVQHRLYDEYQYLCEREPTRYLRIACVEGGQLCSIDEVTERVWRTTSTRWPHLLR